MTNETAAKNNDREIWRETPGDYYAPSIHVTETGGIGINVGGTVFVMDVREWHARAVKEFDAAMKKLADPRPALAVGETQDKGEPK